MKQQILSEINSKLSALGIPLQDGNGADITISTEFLDAGWSTGSKKISYEASVFANELDNVVYMYEKTTEVGHGLSFGGGSGSSFQSGTTLFRKVKSVQYGLDGKAYEYTLDLGAIPKAVKETAKQYGWKFKIVINKNKAMYPAGYVPMPIVQKEKPQQQQTAGFCSNCGMQLTEGAKFCDKCGKPTGTMPQQPPDVPPVTPVQAQYNNPQGEFYAKSKAPAPKSKAGTLGLIAFIVLGVITALLFMLMSVNPVGWIIGAIALAVFGFLQKKLARKGCFLSIVLWILAAIILLMTLTFTSPPSGEKGEKVNSELYAKLPYEKSFTLNDGKSVGKFRLFVSDGTGFYANYKGEVINEFYIKFDTSSLPADFKMKDEQAVEKNAMGGPALDGLIMAVCSDTEAYHKTALSYAQAIYNNGNVKPYVETEASTTNINAADIKKLAEKYPKMQVLRYNQNEVGMTKNGDTWITHSEKAFGLHQPITEGNIPWGEILNDLGIE